MPSDAGQRGIGVRRAQQHRRAVLGAGNCVIGTSTAGSAGVRRCCDWASGTTPMIS